MNLTPQQFHSLPAYSKTGFRVAMRTAAPKGAKGDSFPDAGRGPVSISLPWPPTANHLWATGKDRKRHRTPEYDAYLKTAALSALSAGVPIFRGLIDVVLYLHFPTTTTASDTDSRAKACLDAMNGVLWDDDSQIRDLSSVRVDGAAKPRVVLVVTPNVVRRVDSPSPAAPFPSTEAQP